MPQLIRYLDQIAREKQRDVLSIQFTDPSANPFMPDEDHGADQGVERRRQQLIEWLDQNGIGWEPCGPVADPNWMRSYDGRIYVDTPYEPGAQPYQKLQGYLEHPDGRMRLEGVHFMLLRLERAMENAYMDEPGYWDRWAKSF